MSGEQQVANLARFTLSQVAAACGGEIVGGVDGGLPINGVLTDSRAVHPGCLFVALRGERFDGHRFLAQALAGGAPAAVVEATAGAPSGLALVRVKDTLLALGDLARAHRRRFQVPVIGVTGSYGKTTTRAFITAALASCWNVLSSLGNNNNEIGVPQALLQLEPAHRAAVIEMAMRGAGQIAYLAAVAEPTLGIVTNIGPQHMELLGSMDNVARAKAELIAALPARGTAVLPADDDYLDLLQSTASCQVVTFGQSEAADYRLVDVRPAPDGNIIFSLAHHSELRIKELKLPLPGAHHAMDAAAALAVADVLGVPLDGAASRLMSVEVPGGRMRIRSAPDLTIIDDSYNAGPNSMRAALTTLLDFPAGGRRVAVLGAMKELGAWEETEHRRVGEFAGTFVELLIGVGGETRPLLNAALQAARQLDHRPQVAWCEDADEAAQRVPELLEPGDIVLIKGSRAVGLEVVVKALAGE